MIDRRRHLVLATATLLGVACHHELDRVRYANAPIITAVGDRAHLAEVPEAASSNNLLDHYDALVYKPVVRATELRASRLAGDINALGEVPDSSWFTNRISARDLSAAEIRRGPNSAPGPGARKPWTIVRSKSVGVAPGFIIKDASGDRYIVKLDVRDAPETESGAHIVVHRLLWALGYFVPEDYLVRFERAELEIAEDAVVVDVLGEKRPMTAADLDAALARGHSKGGGSFRGLASKFVPGKPLGGFSVAGVRRDDPNDTIAHQHRRVLRGLYPIFAWLKHTDVKRDNTLDALVEIDGRRYVRHYLIDFGKALGVLSRVSRSQADGHARVVDFGDAGRSALSVGIYRRPWDGLDLEEYPGLGYYQLDGYDPGGFKVRFPWEPFEAATDLDKFWGAKLMIRLRPEHIRAAVAEARYSSAAAARYLTDTLIARQRETARYWFRRVNPLDDFAVTPAARGVNLCFDDLARRHRLESPTLLASTRYGVAAYNHGGEPIEFQPAMTRDTTSGRLCVVGLPLADRDGGYTIVSIDTLRPGTRLRPVLVHLARAPDSGRPRVIGVRRLSAD